MKKEDVRATIQEVGIVPGVRTSSAVEARFAAETIAKAGIPIVEITMTVPGAIEVIRDLVQNAPDVIVGAGTVLDIETARLCLKAGANFLTSPGLDLEIVKFAVNEERADDGGRADADRSNRGVEGGIGLREDFPVRAGWRGQLHQGAQGTVSAGAVDRGGRREPADGVGLHFGGGDGAGDWRGIDPASGD